MNNLWNEPGYFVQNFTNSSAAFIHRSASAATSFQSYQRFIPAGHYDANESQYRECSQWRTGRIDYSDQSFDLHIGLHDRLKHARLNPFPGILWRIGNRIARVCLKGNMAVHQHVRMTPWQIFLQNSSTMRNRVMLQVKFPCGSLLRYFYVQFCRAHFVFFLLWSHAKIVLSPRVLCRTVVSDSDGRKWKWTSTRWFGDSEASEMKQMLKYQRWHWRKCN